MTITKMKIIVQRSIIQKTLQIGDGLMLGFIGLAIFGAVFAGAWMSAEDGEQKSREEAKKTKLPILL